MQKKILFGFALIAFCALHLNASRPGTPKNCQVTVNFINIDATKTAIVSMPNLIAYTINDTTMYFKPVVHSFGSLAAFKDYQSTNKISDEEKEHIDAAVKKAREKAQAENCYENSCTRWKVRPNSPAQRVELISPKNSDKSHLNK